MNKKDYLSLAIFSICLLAFVSIANKIWFHDTAEYITIAKNLAGINNLNVYVTHSILYPSIISLFLKISQGFTTIKIINIFWLILIALTFLIIKNKKAFILFTFAPIVWYTSLQTTPILPASLFFFWSYLFLKKEKLLLAGFFLGLSIALYDAMIFITFFFILAFFWNNKFSNLVKFLIAAAVGFFPKMIVDYYYFRTPLFTSIKYAGTMFIGGADKLYFLKNPILLIMILIISPLLFKMYKINFKEYKKELSFIIMASLFLWMSKDLIKYFLLITPLIIFLLSKVISDKDLKWNSLISIILIIILTFNFFGATQDIAIEKDLNKIVEEFKPSYIISEQYNANNLAMFYWKETPKFVWYNDFIAQEQGTTKLREYSFNLNKNQKINSRELLIFSGSFNKYENQTYNNYIFVARKENSLDNHEKIKCYDALCVYK